MEKSFSYRLMTSTIRAIKSSFRLLNFAVVGGGTVHFLLTKVGCPCKVMETSMQPTFNSTVYSDWVFLNRFVVRNFDVKNGDIVAFVNPRDSNELFIKRIIAQEGQRVKATNGEICRIPEGHIWVEGDNLLSSQDSNMFGPLPKALIVAKATHVIWPFSRWTKLENYYRNERVVF